MWQGDIRSASAPSLRQFVRTFPFGHFQVALVDTRREVVPHFIERTPGLPAKLSILLTTEPSEALRKVGRHGRASPPKLAGESKFLEIRKDPGQAIDLLPELSGGPPYFQILRSLIAPPDVVEASATRHALLFEPSSL
jgi:hypothetical protein